MDSVWTPYGTRTPANLQYFVADFVSTVPHIILYRTDCVLHYGLRTQYRFRMDSIMWTPYVCVFTVFYSDFMYYTIPYRFCIVYLRCFVHISCITLGFSSASSGQLSSARPAQLSSARPVQPQLISAQLGAQLSPAQLSSAQLGSVQCSSVQFGSVQIRLVQFS